MAFFGYQKLINNPGLGRVTFGIQAVRERREVNSSAER
jgi:hypothetical protein